MKKRRNRLRKCIYKNPKKYAKRVKIPLKLAKIQCKNFMKIYRKSSKVKCPYCHKKEINYELGSYEEGYSDFFYCDNCGKTFPVDYKPFQYFAGFGFDFDDLLYFSSGKTKEERDAKRIECIGTADQKEWEEYAKRHILDY